MVANKAGTPMVANKAGTPPSIFYLHVLMHIMYELYNRNSVKPTFQLTENAPRSPTAMPQFLFSPSPSTVKIFPKISSWNLKRPP